MEGRVPQRVVKGGLDAPGPEGVEEHVVRVARLVGVVLVPAFAAFMIRVEQASELVAERVHLRLGQHADAGEVAVFAIESHLLVAEPEAVLHRRILRLREEIGDRLVLRGEIGGHGLCVQGVFFRE